MPVLRVSTKSKNGPRRIGIGGEIEDEQQVKLAGLVEQAGDRRDREAEKRQRAKQIG